MSAESVFRERMEEERTSHDCAHRQIEDEDGFKVVSHLCAGCHHYNGDDDGCSLFDDVRQDLCEESALSDLGRTQD